MTGGTKDNHAVALDEKRFARLRISAKAVFAFSDFECSEAGQLHGFPRKDRLGDLLDHKIQGFTNSLPGKARAASMAARILDDIGTIQGKPPYFG